MKLQLLQSLGTAGVQAAPPAPSSLCQGWRRPPSGEGQLVPVPGPLSSCCSGRTATVEGLYQSRGLRTGKRVASGLRLQPASCTCSPRGHLLSGFGCSDLPRWATPRVRLQGHADGAKSALPIFCCCLRAKRRCDVYSDFGGSVRASPFGTHPSRHLLLSGHVWPLGEVAIAGSLCLLIILSYPPSQVQLSFYLGNCSLFSSFSFVGFPSPPEA